MTDPATLADVWFGGMVITAIVLGATVVDRDEDHPLAWVVAAIWPLILAVCIVVACISGPFWLGQQIRRIFE